MNPNITCDFESLCALWMNSFTKRYTAFKYGFAFLIFFCRGWSLFKLHIDYFSVLMFRILVHGSLRKRIFWCKHFCRFPINYIRSLIYSCMEMEFYSLFKILFYIWRPVLCWCEDVLKVLISMVLLHSNGHLSNTMLNCTSNVWFGNAFGCDGSI